MKLYAELSHVRRRQIATDVAAMVAMALFTVLGVLTYRLVAAAAAPGRTIEDAGQSVGRLPGLGGVGTALADAGRAQQDVVLSLGFWLGFAIVAIGVVTVLLAHLPRRLAWASEATTAAQLRNSPADLQLLAYRAVGRRRLSQLVKVVPHPGTALATGNYLPLASIELRELGLRPPS